MTHQELLDKSLSHPIIVFDGECILCNGFIQWFIAHDTDQQLRYACLQNLVHNPNNKLDSVFLYKDGVVHTHSDVIVRAATYLKKPYSYLNILKYVPKGFRDIIYKTIARYRYQIFGKYDTCMLPNVDQKHLFIN